MLAAKTMVDNEEAGTRARHTNIEVQSKPDLEVVDVSLRRTNVSDGDIKCRAGNGSIEEDLARCLERAT